MRRHRFLFESLSQVKKKEKKQKRKKKKTDDVKTAKRKAPARGSPIKSKLYYGLKETREKKRKKERKGKKK